MKTFLFYTVSLTFVLLCLGSTTISSQLRQHQNTLTSKTNFQEDDRIIFIQDLLKSHHRLNSRLDNYRVLAEIRDEEPIDQSNDDVVIQDYYHQSVTTTTTEYFDDDSSSTDADHIPSSWNDDADYYVLTPFHLYDGGDNDNDHVLLQTPTDQEPIISAEHDFDVANANDIIFAQTEDDLNYYDDDATLVDLSSEDDFSFDHDAIVDVQTSTEDDFDYDLQYADQIDVQVNEAQDNFAKLADDDDIIALQTEDDFDIPANIQDDTVTEDFSVYASVDVSSHYKDTADNHYSDWHPHHHSHHHRNKKDQSTVLDTDYSSVSITEYDVDGDDDDQSVDVDTLMKYYSNDDKIDDDDGDIEDDDETLTIVTYDADSIHSDDVLLLIDPYAHDDEILTVQVSSRFLHL